LNLNRSNLRRISGNHLAVSGSWSRTRPSPNLSSRAAMRRGICLSFQPLRLCVAQASACVPCFRRGGVYPARRRGAPSLRFVGLPRLGPRQGTAFYPACPDAGREARRATVPNAHYLHRVSTPEAATLWPRPRLSPNLSSRAAMRRGICLSCQPVCLCVAQASACVPRFRRGGVYPARRRGAPSLRFVGLPRLSLRQGTAFYPEARRAAVPTRQRLHRVLVPEAPTLRPRPCLSTNLSSRGATRRGICFSLWLLRSTRPSTKNHSLRDIQ